jgi:hypothetical protein
MNNPSKQTLKAAGALAVAIALMNNLAAAGQGNPGILPPQSRPGGESYVEWASAWWSWWWPMPYDFYAANPVKECRNVWLLTGSAPGETELTLTIPEGKMLFFGVATIAGACWSPASLRQSWSDPVTGTPYASFAAYATWFNDQFMAAVSHVSCKIDGQKVENIWAYRLKSQSRFAGEYPVDNWAGADPGTEFVGLADGIYLMLAPLPVGKHKIECYCEYGDQFGDYGVVSGPVKTVYHITVKRAGKH